MITKVLLRDRQTHRYYAGPGQWVPHAHQALDLGETSRAAKVFEAEGLEFAEILIDHGSLPAGPHRPEESLKSRPHARTHRHS